MRATIVIARFVENVATGGASHLKDCPISLEYFFGFVTFFR